MRINILNIILMALAMAVSIWRPYECFVLVYGFLGPAHYLTQISWMHDRNYFTTGKFDPVILVFPAIITATFEALSYPAPILVSYFVIWISFGGAIVMTFNKTFAGRLLWFTILTLTLLMMAAVPRWLTILAIFLFLLPTIVHVYVFTGLFILVGALKTKSITGYLSLVFYLLCGTFPFFMNFQFSSATLSPYFAQAFAPFSSLETELNRLLQDHAGKGSAIVLISFSYFYHYLNWFSKTRIIKWHKTPPQRLYVIIGLYVFFVGLYAIDYSKGFFAILALSLAHVLLEFPLNCRTIREIGQRLLARG